MSEGSFSGDDAFLDELFDRFVRAIAEGDAIDLAPAMAERPELRERIEELHALAQRTAVHRAPRLPEIEGYEVLAELGRGGMGSVYVARQLRLDRVVALKTLSARMLGGTRGRERFEREVRAVARLQHPGIIPLYEVGEIEGGVPYFTMEYVEGRSLAEVVAALRGIGRAPAELDAADLVRAVGGDPEADTPGWGSYVEGVARIAQCVARALEHAHERGVVHRDVKPSNVMLCADGRALLFDFGIARMEKEAELTRTGEFVGTPCYVSPEQASGVSEVSAPSDQYGLGATLYELLTLRPPFSGSVSEVLRRIQTQNPPPPRRLNPHAPRDLETICLRAMEKEPGRRYASTAALADDLRRFLEFRPIEARPIGVWTRSARFVRRNRALSAALLSGALLLLGTPTALWLQARAATREIRLQGDKSLAIRKFLEEMLSAVDPFREGKDVKMSDVLSQAEGKLQEAFTDQPEIAVALRRTIGNVYGGMGLPEKAEPLLRGALALADAKLEESNPERIETLTAHGWILYQAGRFSEGEPKLRDALRLSLKVFGPENDTTSSVRNDLGLTLCELGRYEEGLKLLAETLDVRRRTSAGDGAQTWSSVTNLGGMLLKLGRYEEAAPLVEEGYRLAQQIYGGIHPSTIASRSQLTELYLSRRQFLEAESLVRDGVDAARERLGPGHHYTMTPMNDLAMVLLKSGQIPQAVDMLRAVLDLRVEHSGAEHDETLLAMSNLGYALQLLGKKTEAEELYRKALPLQMKLQGPRHSNTLTTLNNLGSLLLGTDDGRLAEAEKILREVVTLRREILGDANQLTVYSRVNLAGVLERLGRFEEADEHFQAAIRDGSSCLTPYDRAAIATQYGGSLVARRQVEEAEDQLLLAEEAFDGMNTSVKDGYYRRCLTLLVQLCVQAGREEDAQSYRARLAGD